MQDQYDEYYSILQGKNNHTFYLDLFRIHRAAAGASKPRRTIEKFSRHSRNFRSKIRFEISLQSSICSITFDFSAKCLSQRTMFQQFFNKRNRFIYIIQLHIFLRVSFEIDHKNLSIKILKLYKNSKHFYTVT